MTQSLQEFVEDVQGASHLRIEQDFGDGFVRLRTSEAERRQAAQDIQNSESIVLELLRNARDAHAAHVFVAVCKESHKRSITVIDDGDGIPANMHELVFEPRVTSKLDTSHRDAWGLHGRGMALYSISVNAQKARIASSAPSCGTALHIITDTTKLPERSDQSTFPTFTLSESGTVNVRGPRNILRTACEFAIECRSGCNVYVGSPAEVCATLYSYGLATLSALDRLFCDDIASLPLVKRLATASDPANFTRIAAGLGLDISQRTARRIMDAQIDPLDPILDGIVIQEAPSTPGNARPKRMPGAKSHVKLSAVDKRQFQEAVMEAFTPLADAYYLEPDVACRVQVRAGNIVVSIPIAPKE